MSYFEVDDDMRRPAVWRVDRYNAADRREISDVVFVVGCVYAWTDGERVFISAANRVGIGRAKIV